MSNLFDFYRKSLLLIFSSFILLIVFSNHSLYAKSLSINQFKYCKDFTYEESLFLKPENFQKIKFKLFINEKKFSSILIENILNIKSNGYIKNKQNKIKSIILLEIADGKSCYLEARIRPHGDLGDHHDFDYRSLKDFKLPSLRVELTNTHIFGIVEFILFRPFTRNGENEVFINSLFSTLGYHAPRTSFADVSFKNINYEMIFQEVINKEFLEYNQLVEGPILSGDERYVFENKLPDLSWHKLDNRNWIKQKKSNFKTSKKALDEINNIYFNHNLPKLKSDITFDETTMIDYYTSTLGTKYHDQYKKLGSFDSLLFATMSIHGISRDDRRFYYDIFNNTFIPILYDSHNEQSEGKEVLFPNSKYFNNEGWILKSSLDNSLENINKLDDLNINTFKSNLKKKGFKIKSSNIENRINKIRNNLTYLSKIKSSNKIIKPIFLPKKFFRKKNFSDNLFQTTKYIISNNDKYEVCDLTLTNCKEINLNKIEREMMLNQSLKITHINKFNQVVLSDIIYIGKKNTFKTNNNLDRIKKKTELIDRDSVYINNYTKLKLFGDIKIKINRKNKQIIFYKFDNNSTAYFKNGTLKNWKIEFYDLSDQNKLNKIDKISGFNGCLNFYDMEVIDINITSSNAQCEDAINFVRVSGKISKIRSQNSISDSVDFDFSNLVINKIEIMNSGNDCIDFSYGNFEINYANLINCGDKAVSVGENSKLIVSDINIAQSQTGIASKDYSDFYGENVRITNVNICLSAYNKKQEFSGGLIKVNSLNCSEYKQLEYKDVVSEIIYNDI